jgi:hypothetical protein
MYFAGSSLDRSRNHCETDVIVSESNFFSLCDSSVGVGLVTCATLKVPRSI